MVLSSSFPFSWSLLLHSVGTKARISMKPSHLASRVALERIEASHQQTQNRRQNLSQELESYA